MRGVEGRLLFDNIPPSQPKPELLLLLIRSMAQKKDIWAGPAGPLLMEVGRFQGCWDYR